MARELVRFDPNTPREVVLEFATGKWTDGRFGEQYYFSLEGGRAMYLDPVPAKMLEALQPEVGEPIIIVKKVSGRRGAGPDWEVYLRNDRAETPLEADLRRSIVQNEGRKAAAARGSVHASSSVPARTSYGKPPALPPRLYSEAPRAIAAAPAPAQNGRQIPQQSQYADAFTLFLIDAGRAAQKAEKALGQDGASVRFDSRDIAAIATTMFIAADKQGALVWNGGAR